MNIYQVALSARRIKMNLLKSFFAVVMVSFICIGFAFAQEGQATETVNQEIKDSDVQWVLGEVVSVDPKDNLINVKYLDFEDSIEKDMSVGIGLGTTYENIKSLDEIKPQDSLSIDYTVTSDGKNLAKNISLDKAREAQATGEVKIAGEAQATGEAAQVTGEAKVTGEEAQVEKKQAEVEAQVGEVKPVLEAGQ